MNDKIVTTKSKNLQPLPESTQSFWDLLRCWLLGLTAKVEIKPGEYGRSISVEVGERS